jgi:hypothetical protein
MSDVFGTVAYLRTSRSASASRLPLPGHSKVLCKPTEAGMKCRCNDPREGATILSPAELVQMIGLLGFDANGHQHGLRLLGLRATATATATARS